jgi:diguanylate cyclase
MQLAIMFSDGLFHQGLLTDAAGLAAVSLIAYLFCRNLRRRGKGPPTPLTDELARAEEIGEDLARVAAELSREAKAHGRDVAAFREQVAVMQSGQAEADWRKLRERADRLIGPTLSFATSLTVACHQLRRQQAQLVTFSASRIDPATGLHNRRSLEEHLAAFFSIHAAGERRFSLAMFSVCPAGADAPETSEERLRQVARLLEQCLRDDDFVARYSYDEFVVLMPQTALAGALSFGERLLVRAATDLDCAMWGGVVEAAAEETAGKLLSRADSALYSARAAGETSLYQHTGKGLRRHAVPLANVGGGACPELMAASP